MLGDRAEAKVGYTVRFRLVRDQLRLVHDRFGTTGYWSAVRDNVGVGAALAVSANDWHAIIWWSVRDGPWWLAGGVVTGVIAVAAAFGADGFTLALLGTAAVLAVSDRYAGDLALPVRITSTVVLAAGLVAIAVPGATAMFVRDGLGTTDRIVLVIGSLLALIALGMVTWSWLPSAKSASTVLIVIAGLTSLVLVNVFCVAVGTAATGGSLNGYRAGQMCATIGFVAAGAVALTWARRLRNGDRTLALTAGLLVIGVAVAKLFLFDLAALGGFFRVLVFIVVGLVLLGLGVVYAQSLPEDDPAADCPTGPIPVLQGH